MKKLLAMILGLSLIGTALSAQEKTIVGDDIESGGYGGPGFIISVLDGQLAYLTGGRGAWIINHKILIGGGGYGLSIPIEKKVDGKDRSITFAYGGVDLGYILLSDSVFHGAFHTLLGGGQVGYKHDYKDQSSFVVIEPVVFAEINILSWFRLCVGGGYRFAFGVKDVEGLESRDIMGPAGQVLFKFGSF